jgi:hypothetical protein
MSGLSPSGWSSSALPLPWLACSCCLAAWVAGALHASAADRFLGTFYPFPRRSLVRQLSRRILIGSTALLLLLTAGVIVLLLMSRADAAPNGPPSIRGTITSLTPVAGQGVILVEERPQDQAGSNKASVTVNAATRIYRGRVGASTKGSFGDLRNGQIVEVWFDGPVLTSYPVQATASVILIP